MSLLAILAVAGRQGMSRSRLEAYLWPESDAARARHALDQTIYAIRRTLGNDAVIATGQTLPEGAAAELTFWAARATLSRMRGETDRAKLERLMAAIGESATGSGVIYLTGGATALLFGWRHATIDVDIKADPEPPGLFQAIATLKESLDLNIELASPDQFIPTLPGWRDRSIFIATYGPVSFYHYDLYSQALAKLQRGHARDLGDVNAMRSARLIESETLAQLFRDIQPQLIRYPAIDAATFERVVREFCELGDA